MHSTLLRYIVGHDKEQKINNIFIHILYFFKEKNISSRRKVDRSQETRESYISWAFLFSFDYKPGSCANISHHCYTLRFHGREMWNESSSERKMWNMALLHHRQHTQQCIMFMFSYFVAARMHDFFMLDTTKRTILLAKKDYSK